MMRILEAGGLPVVYDKNRMSDEDNPNGYYETRRLREGYLLDKWDGILEELEDKAIKVLCNLLDYLPKDRQYKVIYMSRDLNEIIASRKKMVKRRGSKLVKTDAEHIAEFQIGEHLIDYRTLRLQFASLRFVGSFHRKLKKYLRIVKFPLDRCPCLHPAFALRDLLHNFLCSDVIVPKIRHVCLCFEVGYFLFLCIKVKDTPGEMLVLLQVLLIYLLRLQT